MLVDFVTCGDCECQSCTKIISCPKTDMLENPCIDCEGTPPYAPFEADESNLHEFGCNEKKSSIRISKPSELF